MPLTARRLRGRLQRRGHGRVKLRQVYLEPYHAAVEAGAATLMSSFNSINGVPACANPLR